MSGAGPPTRGRAGRLLAVTLAASAALIFGGVLSMAQAQEMSTDERIKRLEERLERMQELIKQSEEIDVRSVEERVERLEQRPSAPSEPLLEPGNMIVFRGGAAFLSSDRGNEVFTDVFGTFGTSTTNSNTTGWYVGGALDLLMTRDMWGMMSKTWLLGEIGVEFKRWTSEEVAVAVPSTARTAFSVAGLSAAGDGGAVVNRGTVELTMLTVDISPKIKFFEGSRLRPWIIPVGLDFHVISPPSNDSTVLDLGVQFGGGADYRLWKAFHLGIDGRYHLATNQTSTVNSFGTVGGYVGIGF